MTETSEEQVSAAEHEHYAEIRDQAAIVAEAAKEYRLKKDTSLKAKKFMDEQQKELLNLIQRGPQDPQLPYPEQEEPDEDEEEDDDEPEDDDD